MSSIQTNDYFRPNNMDETLHVLAGLETPAFLVAGATDFIPRMKRPNAQAATVVDLFCLRKQLSQVDLDKQGLHIGSMITHTELQHHPLIKKHVPILAEAVSVIGSLQIRNRGTLGGNIGNASPAGDALPALLVLNASVVLISKKGERQISLAEFILGPSKTAIGTDELITEIFIPAESLGLKGWFKKIGNRSALIISLVSMAMCVEQDGKVRIAFGSVAPYPIRLFTVEEIFARNRDVDELIKAVKQSVKPISDVRASAEYRREMAGNLVYRGLSALGEIESGRE